MMAIEVVGSYAYADRLTGAVASLRSAGSAIVNIYVPAWPITFVLTTIGDEAISFINWSADLRS